MKSIIKPKKYKTVSQTIMQSVGFWAILVLGLLSHSSMYAQCDFSLACNDRLQVSIQSDCSSVITADMILKNMVGTESDYTVTVTNADNTVVPAATVSATEVGDTLQVTVVHIACGLSCVGSVFVEDKLPPSFTDCSDVAINTVTIECSDNIAPTTDGGVVPRPSATDGCITVSYAYVDSTVILDCSAAFAHQIIRTWTVTDMSGNTASCRQTINVNRAAIANVTFPANVNMSLNDSNCLSTIDTLSNGAPSTTVTGIPANASCSNLKFAFEDIIFDLCGRGKNYQRDWTVIDWCTGEILNGTQVIRVEDTAAPILACPTNIIQLSLDNYQCTATYPVPHPNTESIVTTECSEWSYKISYSTGVPLADGTCSTIPTGTFTENNITFNNDGTLDSDGYTKDGTFSISSLPKGCFWVSYSIKDDCDLNALPCIRTYQLVDTSNPTPVCESNTNVTLDNTSSAIINAQSLDAGSWDNCGVISRYEVRRLSNNCNNADDLVFGDHISICCSDILSNPVQAELRVYDDSGNSNTCTVNITVTDNTTPIVSCPMDVVISCVDDPSNLAITGQAGYTDQCGNVYTTAYTDVVSYNDCNIGTISRTWYVGTGTSQQTICSQTITVTNNLSLSNGTVVFPQDTIINACDATSASPDLLNSKPIVNGSGCSNIAISYTDAVSTNTNSYCIQITRTWKIVDWCTFNTNAPSFIEGQQIISINNPTIPVFDECIDRSFVADPSTCLAEAFIMASATVNCPDGTISYTWQVDLYSNGTVDSTGVGSSSIGVYPSGKHLVTFVVTDGCGNTASCSYTMTITDNKAPTPICVSEVVWVLNDEGNAEVWASDFNVKSEDGCTSAENLIYAFDSEGTQTNKVFTCMDIPNGVAERIEVKMYVIDADGNANYCTVGLTLQDSQTNDACTDDPDARANISGRIFNKEQIALQETNVQLENMAENEMSMERTSFEGTYAFSNISFYDSYTIQPVKNDDPLNGVSTLDLILIQKHILDIKKLSTAFDLIAADVNNSGHISSIDLIELRKLILGINDNFSNNNAWRFIPASYDLEDEHKLYDFQEKVIIDSLYVNTDQIDFYALKTGDVNNSARFSADTEHEIENRSEKSLILHQTDQNILSISTTEDVYISGFQLELDIENTGIRLESMKAALTSNHFRYNDHGLSISWNGAEGIHLSKGEILLDIIIDNTEFVSDYVLDQTRINAEAYTEEGLIMDIIPEAQGIDTDILHIDNFPNPFIEETSILFSLETAEYVSIDILDTSGRSIKSMNAFFLAGENQLRITDKELVGAGVYYIKINTKEKTAIHKMIALR